MRSLASYAILMLLIPQIFIAFIPITKAQGNTIVVGPGETYTTVADALAVANDGDTIVFSGDVEESGPIDIAVNVTIDGRGYTWTINTQSTTDPWGNIIGQEAINISDTPGHKTEVTIMNVTIIPKQYTSCVFNMASTGLIIMDVAVNTSQNQYWTNIINTYHINIDSNLLISNLQVYGGKTDYIFDILEYDGSNFNAYIVNVYVEYTYYLCYIDIWNQSNATVYIDNLTVEYIEDYSNMYAEYNSTLYLMFNDFTINYCYEFAEIYIDSNSSAVITMNNFYVNYSDEAFFYDVESDDNSTLYLMVNEFTYNYCYEFIYDIGSDYNSSAYIILNNITVNYCEYFLDEVYADEESTLNIFVNNVIINYSEGYVFDSVYSDDNSMLYLDINSLYVNFSDDSIFNNFRASYDSMMIVLMNDSKIVDVDDEFMYNVYADDNGLLYFIVNNTIVENCNDEFAYRVGAGEEGIAYLLFENVTINYVRWDLFYVSSGIDAVVYLLFWNSRVGEVGGDVLETYCDRGILEFFFENLTFTSVLGKLFYIKGYLNSLTYGWAENINVTTVREVVTLYSTDYSNISFTMVNSNIAYAFWITSLASLYSDYSGRIEATFMNVKVQEAYRLITAESRCNSNITLNLYDVKANWIGGDGVVLYCWRNETYPDTWLGFSWIGGYLYATGYDIYDAIAPGGGYISLIDVAFNESDIYFYNDNWVPIWCEWDFEVHVVDQHGDPIEGAYVTIYDVNGQVVGSGYTGSNGIYEKHITHYLSPPEVDTLYAPYRVEVSYAGETYEVTGLWYTMLNSGPWGIGQVIISVTRPYTIYIESTGGKARFNINGKKGTCTANVIITDTEVHITLYIDDEVVEVSITVKSYKITDYGYRIIGELNGRRVKIIVNLNKGRVVIRSREIKYKGPVD